MRLESKIAISSGALICTMLLSAFSATLRLKEADRLTEEFARRSYVLLEILSVRIHLSRTIVALESEMATTSNATLAARYRDERAKQWDSVDTAWKQLEAGAKGTNLGKNAVYLNVMPVKLAELRKLEEKASKLDSYQSHEGDAEASAVLEDEVLPLEAATFADTSGFSQTELEKAGQEMVALRKMHRLAVMTLWIATVLGALLGGMLAAVLGRNITRAIGDLVERANSIAEGKLTGRELHMGTNDQIDTMAEAMNRMQRSLSAIIGTVADTVGSLTGSAATMGSASDQIHKRIDQQSQQTQQAATAMQEMSASIAEVSRHTQSAAETARAAAQTAREGGAIVKEMLGSMGSITDAVNETSKTVGLLGEDSKRISQIVTVIEEIARKTNLLALNAAIEAARAGEHGRGFGVVAGEVRRLAESTAQATGEIASMIHEIQERTRSAIGSMEGGTSIVASGVVTTKQAGEALERIIGQAERVDRMIAQIAIAASQQAAAADQSSASLDSIHTLSHDNLVEMATTATGIESMRETAVALERQVDKFQVGHANYAVAAITGTL